MTNHQRAQSTIDPQQESSAAASLRAQLRKVTSWPLIQRCTPRPRSNSSTTAADSGISIKSKPALTARDWYYKERSKTEVNKLHVISYASAYTRPAVDLMREILEVRYPEPPPGSKTIRVYGVTEPGTDDESRPLLMTTLPRRRGWLYELRRCGGWSWPRRWNLRTRQSGGRDDQAGSDVQRP